VAAVLQGPWPPGAARRALLGCFSAALLAWLASGALLLGCWQRVDAALEELQRALRRQRWRTVGRGLGPEAGPTLHLLPVGIAPVPTELEPLLQGAWLVRSAAAA
jgi:hypothetical protein